MSDKPSQPILDLKDYFDAHFAIGEAKIPIRVKRFSKSEMEEFTREWEEHFETIGNKTLEPEAKKEADRKSLRFFENRIRECITLDAGYLRDRGADVTTGDGLIGMFHSSHHVLGQLVGQIWLQNNLVGVMAKNSKSPLASDTGSTVSAPTNGEPLTGVEPGSAVLSAESKSSVSTEDAEENPDDKLSGPTPPVH